MILKAESTDPANLYTAIFLLQKSIVNSSRTNKKSDIHQSEYLIFVLCFMFYVLRITVLRVVMR
jgi:hypothetical protein